MSPSPNPEIGPGRSEAAQAISDARTAHAHTALEIAR